MDVILSLLLYHSTFVCGMNTIKSYDKGFEIGSLVRFRKSPFFVNVNIAITQAFANIACIK